MKNAVEWLKDYIDKRDIPEIMDAVKYIMYWAWDNHAYQSKNDRLHEWNPSDQDIYSIVCHVLIGCFLNREMTYQAMIGYIVNDITCGDQIDRIKTAAEVIALIYQHDLIVITKSGDTMYITTEYELDEDIPEFEKHLPEQFPFYTEDNQILGCQFKQHDGDTCVSHINTMNRIALQLNWNVINALPETTTKEELIDTEEWKDFQRRSAAAYATVGDRTFYMKHNYDTRGRCYSEGYYINYQGSAYKKAIIQLAEKEVICLT